jgi:hypothetical protein
VVAWLARACRHDGVGRVDSGARRRSRTRTRRAARARGQLSGSIRPARAVRGRAQGRRHVQLPVRPRFAWWERDAFNTDAIHFHPDSLDETVSLRRKDNLYEFGGGLVWEFAKSWSLRPQILYIRDQSNAVGFNYSSTEVWINVRKGF